jgi:glycosyltransferase involved in cell wall biosynthesis
MEFSSMKVAIVHPWFLEVGGGEKVIEALASIYPEADLFVMAAEPSLIPESLRSRRLFTSSLDKIMRHRMRFKRTHFMPLFPWAVEGLNVSDYDVVISSCGPAVMGVNPSQDAVHISYMHSPQRAWWDLYALRQSQMHGLSRQLFVLAASYMRNWEFCAMQRVDHVVSNSHYIAHRVQRYFRRNSVVIHPPVQTSLGYLDNSHDDYYLCVSRLDIDKGIEFLIHACNHLKRRLVLAGTGRAQAQLKAIAGPTIEFAGYVPNEKLPSLYARCRAFLFAADEDFGIVPVEAQSYGRPVVAYGRGGNLETVRVNDPQGMSDTGIFFSEQSTESVIEGILQFEERESMFEPALIQEHARQFDTSVFEDRMRQFVDAAVKHESYADSIKQVSYA